MVIKKFVLASGVVFISALVAFGSAVFAQNDEPVFKIGKTTFKMGDIYKEDQASFYELEKKKFELIDRLAREKYLEYFWQQKAKESGKSVAAAQKDYESKNVKVSEKELRENIDRFKDHPQLKKLSKKERESQIRSYLQERAKREMYDGIIEAGIKKGELAIVYPEPQEPIYTVKVLPTDHVRYGPKDSDTKPVGCKGDDCPITVVEYSEFQCPFCTRVLPSVSRLMTEYKGKIRWIVRDFPLSFHDRARPAAIAAKCAAQQDKYWQMYSELFKNQRALSDEDLKKYGKNIGLDPKKYADCIAKPEKVEQLIDSNFQSGVALGVSGTPAFFINGRRLSGALPYDEFKRVFEDELKKGKKS